ncbi:MAG: hypothetical protein Q7S52_01920 [bacterium]|nr:hypothetical protein [bacterium]
MKLRFHVGKRQNLFFFIDNLSEWSGYERVEYNSTWLKQGGPLSQREARALKMYSSVAHFLKHDGVFKRFREIFFRIPASKIREFSNERKIAKKTFTTLSHRFDKLWKQYQPVLKSNRLILESLWSDFSPRIQSLLNGYAVLFQCTRRPEKLPQEVRCFLLMMPLDRYQGGKSIHRTVIAIEMECLNTDNTERVQSALQLILHELVHSLFETAIFKQRILRVVQDSPITTLSLKRALTPEIVREALIGAILRNHRTVRYFRKITESQWVEQLRNRISARTNQAPQSKTRGGELNALKNFVALTLHQKTALLIDGRRPITDRYIRNVAEVCAQYLSQNFGS